MAAENVDYEAESHKLCDELFAYYDADGSGQMSLDELCTAMNRLNPYHANEQELKDKANELFKKMDSNYFFDVGMVTPGEFFKHLYKRAAEQAEKSPAKVDAYFQLAGNAGQLLSVVRNSVLKEFGEACFAGLSEKGAVDKAALAGFAKAARPDLSDVEIEARIAGLDRNSDDVVDESEFLLFAFPLVKADGKEDYDLHVSGAKAIHKMQKNADDFVAPEEPKELSKAKTDKEQLEAWQDLSKAFAKKAAEPEKAAE